MNNNFNKLHRVYYITKIPELKFTVGYISKFNYNFWNEFCYIKINKRNVQASKKYVFFIDEIIDNTFFINIKTIKISKK